MNVMTPEIQSPHLPHLLGLTTGQLTKLLGGPGRARLPWQLMRDGQDPFAASSDMSPRARQRLVEVCRRYEQRILSRQQDTCGTIKWLIALEGGGHIETVLIPGKGRSTVCVSSQVGCARGCTFCMTATMGLSRGLTAAEIVGQVLLARQAAEDESLPPLRNVVFMGMGEPLDNHEAVGQSLKVLTDPHGLAIGPRFITVSTVGTSPRAIWSTRDWSCRLAWSLHSADETVRRRLVPTHRHTLVELREAFLETIEFGNRILFIEMTLIDGVNDGDADARALVSFLAPFGKSVRINLLPLNGGAGGHQPATDEAVSNFAQIVRSANYVCTLRTARGQDLNAACGQLATSA